MKQALKQSKVNDEFLTPKSAVEPLIRYLDVEMKVWECTGKNSNITKVLRKHGFSVEETHRGKLDFLTEKPTFEWDMIITNPPYSTKTAFLKKCYEYGKPFAMLMPLTTLEGIARGKMYRKHGIQLLVFDRRVQFIKDKSNWFNASWFCYEVLDRDLIFTKLEN